MSTKESPRPRIDELPTLQIVEVEVPDRLRELEDLVPLDPSVLDEAKPEFPGQWRWN